MHIHYCLQEINWKTGSIASRTVIQWLLLAGGQLTTGTQGRMADRTLWGAFLTDERIAGFGACRADSIAARRWRVRWCGCRIVQRGWGGRVVWCVLDHLRYIECHSFWVIRAEIFLFCDRLDITWPTSLLLHQKYAQVLPAWPEFKIGILWA